MINAKERTMEAGARVFSGIDLLIAASEILDDCISETNYPIEWDEDSEEYRVYQEWKDDIRNLIISTKHLQKFIDPKLNDEPNFH